MSNAPWIQYKQANEEEVGAEGNSLRRFLVSLQLALVEYGAKQQYSYL